MGIKHKKLTTRDDGPDDGRVQASWWNDDHDIGAFLSAIIDLALTPGVFPYVRSDQTVGMTALTEFARGLLALTDAATLRAALAAAPLSSPHFADTPTAPTPGLGTNTDQIATMAALQAMRADLVASSPATLDTLNELATALGDDPNFATTMTNALAARLRFDAAQTLTSGQKAQAIANLGIVLGTAAALDVGTAANKVVQLDGSAKLPAVDGSQLTNVVSAGSLSVTSAQALTAAQKAQGLANLAQVSATKTADYTVVANDRGGLIKLSGTHTLSLTAAATLGDGWRCDIRNTGTGVWTIDPNASETVNGLTTFNVYPGENMRLICDGGAFYTMGNGTGLILLDTQTAIGSATLDFTRFDSNRFWGYRFEIDQLLPATAAQSLYVRGSTNGGTSYISTASYAYGFLAGLSGTTAAAGENLAGAQIDLTSSQGNSAGYVMNGTVDVDPGSVYTLLKAFHASIDNAGTHTRPVNIYGQIPGTANALRFMYASGNIASGTIRMYGLSK